jgi:uncharacterized protein involved in exopolysaccharide biosynthesis
LVKIVGRRWFATLPVVCVVLLLGPGFVASADPEYQASGSVVLLPPAPTTPASDDEEPGNPYSAFSGSIAITAAVLENLGNGEALRQQVAAEGGTTDFTIEQEEETPILSIEATSSTRAEAIATVGIVAAALDDQLAARQDRFDVPEEDRIVLEEVQLPTRASELETSRNRALAIVIGFAVAGVVASAVLAESFATGRKRRRAAAADAARTTAERNGGSDIAADVRASDGHERSGPAMPDVAGNGDELAPAEQASP